LITTNFNVLKYIKKIFKVPTYCIFNTQQRTTLKNPVEILDSSNRKIKMKTSCSSNLETTNFDPQFQTLMKKYANIEML